MDIYHARARARVCVRGARVRGTILASKKIKKNKYNEYIYIHARVCVRARGMAWYLHVARSGHASKDLDACVTKGNRVRDIPHVLRKVTLVALDLSCKKRTMLLGYLVSVSIW